MRRIDYLFVRTGKDGHKHGVNYQLPGEGNTSINAAAHAVGLSMSNGRWAEVKAAALEVSATGQARKIWFGGHHYMTVALSDQRPL